MVFSRINKGIEYITIGSVLPSDMGHESSTYTLPIHGVETEIIIGKQNGTFLDEYGVVYYNVYTIEDDAIGKSIGVYEILYKDTGDIIDEDGDIDLNKFDDIILFESSHPEYLQEKVTQKPYVKVSGEHWIQSFMRDNDYDIIDNEGGGDCLFSSIRDGMKLSGIEMSVKEMRDKIAESTTQDVFEEYKLVYDNTTGEYMELERNIADITKEISMLNKKMIGKSVQNGDVAIRTLIKARQKQLKELQRELSKQLEVVQEFMFMKNVTNLEMFKRVLKTSKYWGDSYAIRTIEDLLNIKLVLLSKAAFLQKAGDSVLRCGEAPMDDTIMYSPEFYIMLSYTGQHYTLITHRGQGTFTHKQLPDDVKKLILTTCMEKMAGSYYMISEFRELMSKNSIEMPVDIEYLSLDDTYDHSDVFQYYNRSMDARPGKGNGEKLGSHTTSSTYRQLSTHSNWRRMLSDHYIHPITIDNHTWNSVTHYINANKFKKNDNEFYLRFAYDVNPTDALAIDPEMAESAGSTTGLHKGKRIRPTHIKIDTGFPDLYNKLYYKALMTKFTSDKTLEDVLKLTFRAKLQKYKRGHSPVISEILMLVRKKIST